jgi:hypothetical protein
VPVEEIPCTECSADQERSKDNLVVDGVSIYEAFFRCIWEKRSCQDLAMGG